MSFGKAPRFELTDKGGQTTGPRIRATQRVDPARATMRGTFRPPKKPTHPIGRRSQSLASLNGGDVSAQLIPKRRTYAISEPDRERTGSTNLDQDAKQPNPLEMEIMKLKQIIESLQAEYAVLEEACEAEKEELKRELSEASLENAQLNAQLNIAEFRIESLEKEYGDYLG